MPPSVSDLFWLFDLWILPKRLLTDNSWHSQLPNEFLNYQNLLFSFSITSSLTPLTLAALPVLQRESRPRAQSLQPATESSWGSLTFPCICIYGCLPFTVSETGFPIRTVIASFVFKQRHLSQRGKAGSFEKCINQGIQVKQGFGKSQRKDLSDGGRETL